MHTILYCKLGVDFRKLLTELDLAEISSAAGMERQMLGGIMAVKHINIMDFLA